MDPISTGTQQTVNTASTPQSATNISSDFDTFLRMLTTQLENQDPLQPMDSQELAVQLATFSGVEQQTQTNKLLEDLGSQMGLMSLSQLADWVGMEALAPGEVYFEGQPLELAVEIPKVADKAELVVRRPDGSEVQRKPLELDTETLAWAGVGADSAGLPAGKYAFSVESFSQNNALASTEASAYREVIEVRSDESGTSLITAGDVAVDAANVTRLRPGA